jgi:LmbE family N-acetylglucosaminyl deacetylase
MVTYRPQALEPLKLMCILAHPDDESLGTGGALAKYAAEGVETYLICATRGEYGWTGHEEAYPGPQALGRIREAELQAAAKILGLKEVIFLDYLDGQVDGVEPAGAIEQLVTHLRRIRPQVVLTFDPYGAYGHPDHIAICQFATAAVMAAAGPGYADLPNPPHQVAKLYYWAEIPENVEIYESLVGELGMQVDGQARQLIAWPEWAITTWIDASAYWRQVWQAIRCHRSQLSGYGALETAPAEIHQKLWGRQAFYRAFSLVNGGRERECDLFEGLREPELSRLSLIENIRRE